MSFRQRVHDPGVTNQAGGSSDSDGLSGLVREGNDFLDLADRAIDRVSHRDVESFMRQRHQTTGQ